MVCLYQRTYPLNLFAVVTEFSNPLANLLQPMLSLFVEVFTLCDLFALLQDLFAKFGNSIIKLFVTLSNQLPYFGHGNVGV